MANALPKLLVAGLGNATYPSSRHSIGHMIVNALALRLGIQLTGSATGVGGMANVTVGRTKLLLHLYKSKHFMNISGPSIVSTYRQTVNSPTSFIVISDSLDHQPQTLSVRLGGSAQGHNGVKSIINALGGEMGFYRFRAGIGRDEDHAALYVMRNINRHEKAYWSGEGLDRILDEIEKIAIKNSSR